MPKLYPADLFSMCADLPAKRVCARDLRAPHGVSAARLAESVVAALIDEVTLSPKPGLVDLRGSGAHRDLSWSLMCTSATALQPAFEAMARAGLSILDDRRLRETIGALGREGEARMFDATGGINTHRGAIWALGLLVTAAAQDLDRLSAADVASRAGALARLPDRHAPATTGNKGEAARRTYQVGGACGQAQAAFPHVIDVALPELARSRCAGDTETAARLNALLAIMASLDDTCVLARGGRDALRTLQHGARDTLERGGAGSPEGRRALKALDRRLLDLHVSPGGAADLLAAALFLDRLAGLDAEHPAEHPSSEND
ncbi:triphosphoribosyl-dephospho-CoA synthase [Pararobbsia silviterrae]|uniref:Probable 2-(5''-triphosphoribosyl)-3'-dephosphocoenzyme-A synthase n=2 Tax=Pararobbsia silviterrae TaxID=1792498 RepID=A0A494XZT2_9BURK|nr:triphosphoribosyl-dephospho-CoA synthase [Pararobbsia silviterrae]